MSERDLYIAAYDISSARRLRAALKLVKGHATGGQKSAYECFLTPAERRDLLRDLRAVIEPGEDRVLAAAARSRCRGCAEHRRFARRRRRGAGSIFPGLHGVVSRSARVS